MRFVGRPKPPKTIPRSLPQPAVAALLQAVEDREASRRTDWPERDLALILTGLLAGFRLEELRRADVADIRTGSGDGAVIYVRGKGDKDRTVPIEADLLEVLKTTSIAGRHPRRCAARGRRRVIDDIAMTQKMRI